MKHFTEYPVLLIKGKNKMYWNDILKEYHSHPSSGKFKCKCRAYTYEDLIKQGYKP